MNMSFQCLILRKCHAVRTNNKKKAKYAIHQTNYDNYEDDPEKDFQT